jgi:bacteriorhodopsin
MLIDLLAFGFFSCLNSRSLDNTGMPQIELTPQRREHRAKPTTWTPSSSSVAMA